MPDIPPAVAALGADLREIFGARFESLVIYGDSPAATPIHTLAVVTTLGIDDLQRCARKAAAWHDAGLATPLVLAAHEFERSLDVFPFEFGAIIATHTVASGRDPFEGIAVDEADLRRACEVQARSHLLHLREGYIETRGRSDALADLVNHSSASFAALLNSVSRLRGSAPSLPAEVTRLAGAGKVSSQEATKLFPEYLAAVQEIVGYVDRWSPS